MVLPSAEMASYNRVASLHWYVWRELHIPQIQRLYLHEHVCIAHYIAKVVAEEEKKGRKSRRNKLHL